MNPEKVHGPDGLTSLFYQKFDGIMANGLSDANICLIPKKKKQMGCLSFDQLACVMSDTNNLQVLMPKIGESHTRPYTRDPISLCCGKID